MSHSLIGADGRTHCKIVAVAIASAAGFIIFGSAALRTAADGPTSRAQAKDTIFVAGRSAMSAAAAAPIMR